MSDGQNEPEQDDARSRLEQSQLRRRMLDAAQRLVEQAGGLSVSLENLSLDVVIKEAGVSRTSVYREWRNKEAFYVDLLCNLAGPNWQGTAAFDEETIRLVRDVVAERLDLLQTLEGRRQVMLEAIRQGAEQNFRAVVTSTQWRTYVALTATVLSMPTDDEARARVQEALQTSESTFIDRMASFYEDMGVIIGFRLRPHVDSFSTLAAAGASVVEGLGLRRILIPDVVEKTLSLPGPNGDEEWHLAALGFLGIIDQLVEMTPDYAFTIALPQYLKRLSDREATLT